MPSKRPNTAEETCTLAGLCRLAFLVRPALFNHSKGAARRRARDGSRNNLFVTGNEKGVLISPLMETYATGSGATVAGHASGTIDRKIEKRQAARRVAK